MNSNKKNTSVGKEFQLSAKTLLEEEFKTEFDIEQSFLLGNQATENIKPHSFDLVSKDRQIVAECKCYTWTEGQNTPSAKISKLNEAVLYFNLMPKSFQGKKIIVMKKAVHPKKEPKKTLAQYYMDKYYFALEGITLIEIDPDKKQLEFIEKKIQ